MTHARPIKSLWSGYGECFRAVFERSATPVVVKAIVPPDVPDHPKGWNSTQGHARKIHSFRVEKSFYLQYQPLVSPQCYAPRLLYSDSKGDAILLVLEDLLPLGYPKEQLSATVEQCKSPLRWLAHFHARFLNVHTPDMWETGCYWHLDTRGEEWHAMANSPLKRYAQLFDTTLRQTRFQTLLHGDAKIANFCFSPDMARCAAFDFQYTGQGPGIRDVAYFLGSALSDNDLLTSTDACLNYYFRAFRHALAQGEFASVAETIEQQWRALYPVACADFHRFLAGWSPQHRKINQALQQQTDFAIATLTAQK